MNSSDSSAFFHKEPFVSWSGFERLQSVCLGMILLPIDGLCLQEEHLFTPHERAKMEKMSLPRRKTFIATRVALKRLARQLGLVGENRPGRTIETLGPDNVKPCLADSGLYCSVSHSGPMVAAVAHSHPIGVDLENISEKVLRALGFFGIAGEQELISLSPLGPQRAATRIWTGKEAAAKAWGLHLFQALREVEMVRIGEKEGLVRYQNSTYPVWHSEGNGQVITLITCNDL
ncbi:MAG: hypothetical protein C0407_06340 [Desulfobacca sp.]|nr:hypothetical protein [Desulfobacca sp.]